MNAAPMAGKGSIARSDSATSGGSVAYVLAERVRVGEVAGSAGSEGAWEEVDDMEGVRAAPFRGDLEESEECFRGEPVEEALLCWRSKPWGEGDADAKYTTNEDLRFDGSSGVGTVPYPGASGPRPPEVSPPDWIARVAKGDNASSRSTASWRGASAAIPGSRTAHPLMPAGSG